MLRAILNRSLKVYKLYIFVIMLSILILFYCKQYFSSNMTKICGELARIEQIGAFTGHRPDKKMSGNVTSHASIKYWRVNWDQEFKKETGFGQVCKNGIITPSGKNKLCNKNLTLLFVISTFLNSYIGMLPGGKINDDTWSISGEIYIIESKGTCTWFYFMFVPHSLCNI